MLSSAGVRSLSERDAETLNSKVAVNFRRADALRRRAGIPGATLGVTLGGRAVIRGFGVVRAGGRERVTPRTLFQIGSITKTFVAALLCRLRREGRLDLDRPIVRYLRGFRLADAGAARGLTLRHILTHRGGWGGDYFDDTGRGNGALAEFVGRLTRLPQLSPLGSVWAYNNTGFCIAGRVVEVVARMPFEDAMARWVFGPAGLQNAFFFADEAIDHPFATGHDIVRGRAVPAAPWAMARSAHPAGGIVTDMVGLLRFADAHLRGRFLTAGDRAMLFARHGEAGCGVDSMGLSWMRDPVGGETLLWHSGATNGQTAHLCLIPARGFAFAGLTNAGGAGPFLRGVQESLLSSLFGLVRRPSSAVPVEPRSLRQYLGTYEAQLARLTLVRERGALVVHSRAKGGFPKVESPPLPSPPPVRLEFVGEDRVRFAGASGPLSEGEFLRSADGSVAWLRLSGRLHARRG